LRLGLSVRGERWEPRRIGNHQHRIRPAVRRLAKPRPTVRRALEPSRSRYASMQLAFVLPKPSPVRRGNCGPTHATLKQSGTALIIDRFSGRGEDRQQSHPTSPSCPLPEFAGFSVQRFFECLQPRLCSAVSEFTICLAHRINRPPFRRLDLNELLAAPAWAASWLRNTGWAIQAKRDFVGSVPVELR
jgi:hypothetical protein